MLILKQTSQFRKDYKRIKKRGYAVSILAEVLKTLLAQKPLEQKYQDHQLTGKWKDFRECHLQNDWLLIYQVLHKELILLATRTGTHADFGW
ncbi:toxin YafQ [Candidatus Termititenax aidoneus]|uniref:Toxin YafQ n=3 Tax=Candidatus Termititenax TaxID=2507545 RepID=A0A388TB06_TERA1|nr:toxin YafQ [Candidatus Termititenax aidoneus]